MVWLYPHPCPLGDEYHQTAVQLADGIVDELLRRGRPIDTPFLSDIELLLFTKFEQAGIDLKEAEATANYHISVVVERALAAGIPDFRDGDPDEWGQDEWDEGDDGLVLA